MNSRFAIHHKFLIWVFLVLGLPIFGGESSIEAQEESTYRLGPGDKIELRVDEMPDMDRQFTVLEDGTLELPQAGSMRAQGRTESELASDIRGRLEELGMRRATVIVRIVQYSRPVALLGEIAKPGNFPLTGRATLLDVLLEAGGLTVDAGLFVVVRRRSPNGLSDQIEIPVEELFGLGDPIYNIPIFAGDVIRAPSAPTIQISFLGEVENTGSQIFRGNRKITLLVAIAGAGGLTDQASSKIRILRDQGADADKKEILVNYRHILSGKVADVELLDRDIVVVKESFF